MKKLLSLLLAVVMVLLLTGSFAEEPASEWVFSGNSLKEYNGDATEVIVPAEFDGVSVTHLSGSALSNRPDLTSITFSEGIISLGLNIIPKGELLEQIVLPKSLQAFQGGFLSGTKALREVVIPANVRVIKNAFITWTENMDQVVFEGPCPLFLNPELELYTVSSMKNTRILVPDDQVEAYRAALTHTDPELIQPSGNPAKAQTPLDPKLTFDPETGTVISCESTDAWVDIPAEIDGVPVRAIGHRAFEKCRYLFAVTIPDGVESIGEDAFRGLDRLSYIRLPASVQSFGPGAFYEYAGREIFLPEGLTEIPDQCFMYASSVEMDLMIPSTVLRIGDKAFSSVSSSRVFFPAGLESVGSQAFAGYHLTELHFASASLPEIAEDAFQRQSKDVTVFLPRDAADDQLAAAQEKFSALLENVTIVREALPEGAEPASAPEPEPAPESEPGPATDPEPAPEPELTPEPEPVPDPVPQPADGSARWGMDAQREDYIGLWYEIYLHTGGGSGDPREMWDLHDTLELRADGTGRHTGQDSDRTWGMMEEQPGFAIYDDAMGLVLLPDGYLQWGSREGGYSIMSRDPEAHWTPGSPVFEDLYEQMYGVAETVAPTSIPAVEPAAVPVISGDFAVGMDTKYVCTSFIASGYRSDAAILGSEYSVIFHADGTAEFAMAGTPVPGLHWVADGNDAVIDYYGSGELRFVPGEEGLWMDFFGSMNMLFTPAE